MNAPQTIIGTLFAIAAGALAPAAPATSMRQPVPTVETTYGKLPARLCLAADAAQWKGLRAGTTRLALEVRNHAPAARYSPTFNVRLADGDARSRTAPHYFGMAADQRAADGRAEPQQFQFDLAASLGNRADTALVCVDVDIDRDSDDAKALAAAGLTLTASWSQP